MKRINISFLLLISIALSSCGFHLRGSQDLSSVLPEVQIQGTSVHSELGRSLRRALTSAKVAVLAESEVLLKITKDDFFKRVLSLDSAGRANQYELNYQLNFELVKKEQEQEQGKAKLVDLIASQTVTEKREYLFDANLVLAKADEEARLNNDMRQSAMLQLIRRLKFSMKTLKSGNKVSN